MGSPQETGSPIVVSARAWSEVLPGLQEHFTLSPAHRYRVLVQHKSGYWVPVLSEWVPLQHMAMSSARAMLEVDGVLRDASDGQCDLELLRAQRLSDPGVTEAVTAIFQRVVIPLPVELLEWKDLLMYPSLLVAEAVSALFLQDLLDGPPGSSPVAHSAVQETLAALLADVKAFPSALAPHRSLDIDAMSTWEVVNRVADQRLLSAARAL